jgi:hypothetical protein
MNKAELRKALTEKGIAFTEKDGIKALKEKLGVTKLPTITDPSLPYVLFESEDDNQILAEMQGAVLDKFVYSFPQEGKDIVGLSKAGVEQACRESANKKGEVYRIIDTPVIEEDAEYIKVIVKAGRYKILLNNKGDFKGEILLDTSIGAKRQWKKLRQRDGKIVDNKFAYEVAISKAQRNAKMSLLPYAFITEMIKLFKKGGKEQVIQPNRKIGASQLQFIHAIASENGLTHEKLGEVVRKEFGYTTLNELEMNQVNRVVELIKASKPKVVELPLELLGIFNSKGIMKAKRDAMWLKALEISKGDENKAVEFLKQQLESEE